jgi:hypothetical protein
MISWPSGPVPNHYGRIAMAECLRQTLVTEKWRQATTNLEDTVLSVSPNTNKSSFSKFLEVRCQSHASYEPKFFETKSLEIVDEKFSSMSSTINSYLLQYVTVFYSGIWHLEWEPPFSAFKASISGRFHGQ